MNLWKRLPEIFVKDALGKTDDVFEKARIRIAFNISVIIILMLIPLDVTLLSSELYLSFSIAVLIKVGMVLCIYFVKNYRLQTGAIIATISVFVGLTLDILFSETVALVDVLWFALLIMFAFFLLGSIWGSIISIGSVIIGLIYILFFFYDNFHNENVYTAGQLVSLGITVVVGFFLVYLMVKEVREAQEDAEAQLKASLKNLLSLNEQLQKLNQELNVSNKNLESFSHSVSHDLRSPLRSINGYVELLIRDNSTSLSARSLEMLAAIQRGADRMKKLIEDLLTFSRAGRKELSLEKVNMSKLLTTVIEEYKKNEGDIASEIKVNALPEVMADESLMSQVWYNLLSNAIKYSSRKEKPVIEINAKETPEEIIYSIKDNGVGFDMQYVSKLFNIFQRLHTEEEFKGTGVGLAIVKQIITRQGGRVWADSKLGQGATFYFALPKQASGVTLQAA